MNDLKTRILHRLANGQDFKATCQAVGISRQKGYRMRNADPGFDAQVKRLQATGKPISESRAAIHEQQRFEAEADLREKQRQDPRQQEPAELQQSESEKKLSEYHEGEIQYIPTVGVSGDHTFLPGMQPEWRQRQLELQDEIEYNQRRNRFYANPWNWHRPFRDDL